MTFGGTERVWFVLISSVMLPFVLSDALLITLSWCIRGTDVTGHLSHVTQSQLRLTQFNTLPCIYSYMPVYSCLHNRGLLEAADPQELPSCLAQQVSVLKITLRLQSIQASSSSRLTKDSAFFQTQTTPVTICTP